MLKSPPFATAMLMANALRCSGLTPGARRAAILNSPSPGWTMTASTDIGQAAIGVKAKSRSPIGMVKVSPAVTAFAVSVPDHTNVPADDADHSDQ